MICEEFRHAVTDYLEGALPAEQRHGFEHHLASCAACDRHLHQLQQTVLALKQLEPTPAPAAIRQPVIEAFERRWAARDQDLRPARSGRLLDGLDALLHRYSSSGLLGLGLLASLLLSLTSGPARDLHRPGLARICVLVELSAGLLPASVLLLLSWRERHRLSAGTFAVVAAWGAIAGQTLLFAVCPMLDSRVHALVIHSVGVALAIALGTLVGCLPVAPKRG